MSKFTLREEWLAAGRDLLKSRIFDPQETHVPPVIRVSVGLCGTKAIGLCVDTECAEDGAWNVFIDPRLKDPVEVLSTLLHEMIHAIVGLECKHRGPFVEMIRRVGLEGKPTSTFAAKDSELYTKLTAIALELGDYPHAALTRKKKEPKPSKWIAFVSRHNEDYIVRANKETIAEYGLPIDPWGDPVMYKNPEDRPEEDQESDGDPKELGDE